MRTLRSAAFATIVATLTPCLAQAQSAPGWTYKYVPTPAEWNAAFAKKQDYLGAPPILTTGGTMLGSLITAPSTTVQAGFNLPAGSAPTLPNNGDLWSTSAGFFGQVNGVTVGPFTSGTSGSFTATNPIVVSFPGGGVVNVACSTCGITGNPLSQFAATTSAQLAGVISDETGTGSAVFSNSPVLVTPNLGTPSAAVLTHGTGLPVSTGLTGVGTGVLTALATAVNATGGLVTYSGSLGTPAQGVLTYATGLPISTGLSGAGTGVLTALGAATNGTGGLVTYSGQLGTPTQGVATNLTGLPISTGLAGAGTGVLTALGNPAGGSGGVALNSQLASYLPLAGGTMAGNLAMGSNAITGAYSVSAQTFASSVATGTAPFTVASATNVPNLNASSLNGATFASPGAIGGGTAAAGTFTTLSATTYNGGALSGTFSGTPTLSGANFITLANLAQSTAGAQFVGVTGASAGNYAPFTLASLPNLASPSATLDLIPCVDHTSGTIKNCTPGAIAGSATAGVSALNTATGNVTLLTEPQGRITLAANTPVMTATSCSGGPCSGIGTLRYDADIGNQVPYYNGTSDVIDTIASNEVTDTMTAAASAGQVVSGQVYDVWWTHGGANRICLAMSSASGGGGGWASDTSGSNTARGTGYTQLDRVTRPYITNKNSIANCFNLATNYGPISANQGTYLGTVYASGNGQVSYILGGVGSGGVASILGVWNMYNRRTSTVAVNDNGSSYTYTSSTARQARGSANNQATVVTGLAEDGASVFDSGSITTAAMAGAGGSWGVGLDSTTSYAFKVGSGAPANASFTLFSTASGTIAPQAGLHVYSANENSDGSNANTFDVAGLNVLNISVRN